MLRYYTGYFVTLRGRKFTPKKYSQSFQLDEKLKLTTPNYKGENWKISWEYSVEWNGLEFIIDCDSYAIAQNVLFNVLCAAAVIDGTITWGIEPHEPFRLGADLSKKARKGYSSGSIPDFFHLTAIASKDRKVLNAITKYQLSTQVYSHHPMDLHESINWKKTNYSYIQMRFAYAIIIAYSVIEELGLEIRGASSTKPSMLSDRTWDSDILDDLIKRLTNSNIDVSADMEWLIRGEESEIEKRRPIQLSRKIESSDEFDFEDDLFLKIKDGHVLLPDAIRHISYLRSSVASHSVGERIFELSVFDVGNAQHLARRLLLESLNLWR